MHSPAPPEVPVLDKSRLFVYLPTNPQDETRRYLECEAAGHLYCMSTGSLLWKKAPNITSSVNILPLLPSNPTPCTTKTTNIDQQCNGAMPSSASINSHLDPTTKKKLKRRIRKTKNTSIPLEENYSPKVKDIDLPTQGDSAVKPQSNIVPNAHQHVQDNETSKIPKTQSNRTLEVKHGDQVIQDSASGIQNISSKVTNNQTPNVNITDKPVQCKGVSSISKTTYKVKHAGQPIQGNKSSSIFSYIQCNKNAFHNKADQPMLGTNESRTPNAQRNKASKSKSNTSSPANIPIQSAIHSCASIDSNFDTTTNKKRKKRIRKTKKKSKKKSASSRKKKSTDLPQSKPTPSVISTPLGFRNPRVKSQYKKQKNLRAVSNSLNIWAILKPFNRRPHPSRHRPKSLLSSQCKNCIMASSVHEIIHSPFAENENELLHDSQMRAMLNSGDRKLRTRKKWIQRMEEDAIHKYKKLSFENHGQRLQVKEYDVLHHEDKFWLACSSRTVINKKTKESWPLLVKCLHKYPDSTLRQASKHRSFCLSWNGISYFLQMDHAYYTQIQCHMAITNTSYAELVVHTNKETTILPVYFNSEFWKQTEETLQIFFIDKILPYFKKNKIQSTPISDPFNSENSNDSIEE
ncbi:micronuclear linker histone polyprotein-like isoform X1 [Eleutherodactylus coqui]|uniref:micronuclear linker histone polyprotein-like isoform X1 n=1 Tax=Eleutherodactylus coqui TaxID=57060 RepID=UPI003462BC58